MIFRFFVLIVFFTILAGAGRVSAVTCLSDGTIDADCSWILADSPVSLGNLTLSSGVTATVETGVVLSMATDDMNIYGTLNVNGGASIDATDNHNVADILVQSGGAFNLASTSSITHSGSGRINVEIYGSANMTGASLNVNFISAYPGASCSLTDTTINAAKIAFYKGSNCNLVAGNIFTGGIFVDSDSDGIFDDGDRNGTIGDNPCTGGITAGCDDNCSQSSNAGQQDTDSDGYGNMCDADLDNDGFVGPNDYTIFGQAWWSNSSSANWNADADLDGDGFVGPNDYTIFGGRWWTSAPWY